ncbi:unnamed protein product [Cochlearia groenlandica]
MGRTFSYSLSDPTEAPEYVYDDDDEVRSYNHDADPVHFGHQKICFCGEDVILEASSSKRYPGRLYYTCTSRNDGGAHMREWWDEVMMEDIKEQFEKFASVDDMAKKTKTDMVELKNLMNKLFVVVITLVVAVVVVSLFK